MIVILQFPFLVLGAAGHYLPHPVMNIPLNGSQAPQMQKRSKRGRKGATQSTKGATQSTKGANKSSEREVIVIEEDEATEYDASSL